MFLFIVNEKAGNGKGARFWPKIKHKLLEKEMNYKKITSKSEAYTRQSIKQIAEKHAIQAIVVIGGDGTINSVLQEVKPLRLPLAIFPTGTGNDTARMFQLTDDPTQFINQLHDRRLKDIDLLQVNDRFGITVAGIGIDAMIAEKVNESTYKSLLGSVKLSSLSYLIAIFQIAVSFQPFQTMISIDGKSETFGHTWLIACGNTTFYGGGLHICPHADPTDGQLQITMFHSLPRLKALLRILPTVLSGKPNEKDGISYRVGKEVSITTKLPIKVVLDGEIIAQTPISIRIHRQALRLIMTQ